jgi:hypothetical protein
VVTTTLKPGENAMNFHQLIRQREVLLQQARLANMAYAYHHLCAHAERIANARLQGLVELRPCDPIAGQPWPRLVALEGSQSVIEEYFVDEQLGELADILGFLGEGIPEDGLRFRLEELGPWLLPVIRRELASAGVVLADGETSFHDRGRQQA